MNDLPVILATIAAAVGWFVAGITVGFCIWGVRR